MNGRETERGGVQVGPSTDGNPHTAEDALPTTAAGGWSGDARGRPPDRRRRSRPSRRRTRPLASSLRVSAAWRPRRETRRVGERAARRNGVLLQPPSEVRARHWRQKCSSHRGSKWKNRHLFIYLLRFTHIFFEPKFPNLCIEESVSDRYFVIIIQTVEPCNDVMFYKMQIKKTLKSSF